MRDKSKQIPPEEVKPFVFADWEHAKLAIQETGGWIKNADAKITILAGSFGVSLTFAAPRLVNDWRGVMELADCLIGVWVILCAALLVVAFIVGANIYAALAPQTSTGSSPANRFAWPDLANRPFETLPDLESENAVRREAWEQAIVLAQIARNKYSRFRRALLGFAGYLALLTALTVYGAALV